MPEPGKEAGGVFAPKPDRRVEARFIPLKADKIVLSHFGVTRIKSSRRFFFQADSSCPDSTGREAPKVTVLRRCGLTPRLARYSRAARARRSPSERLYFSVPRSSQLP